MVMTSAWSLNTAAVRSWQLYRNLQGNDMSLPKFIGELMLERLRKNGKS